MAMLIGSVFRFSAADITFTSDLINRRGLITPPEYPINEGTRLEPFFKRALLCSFDCYITEQVIPMWRAQYDGGSMTQLIQQEIGRAHVCTQVTNAQSICRHLL